MRTSGSRKRYRRRVELAGEAGDVWVFFLFFFCLMFVFFYLAPSLIFLIHVTRNKEKTHCGLKKSFICVKRSFKERFICIKLSFRHSVERLRIFLSPHLKKKKMNTATKDPPQSELEPRTPRSRILSLST